MSSPSGKRRFARIDRLPPYVFNITAELKLAARRRGEDIIDMSMGNPDGATPPHIVAKLTEVAQRPDTHGYSASKGIPRLRRAISHWYKDRYKVDIDADKEAIVTIGSKEGLANKRVGNILKKAETAVEAKVDTALLKEAAEHALYEALQRTAPKAQASFEEGDYTASLQALAVLKAPVDAFFDGVMVNAEDAALKANRLGLLATLHQAMNQVADISRLAA